MRFLIGKTGMKMHTDLHGTKFCVTFNFHL